MRTDKKILIIILMIGALLRLYSLNSVPPGLTPDEASLGYNAYSILKTGKDEYGNFLPMIFKSFGDYKPGLYVYLTIPFVAILGLNETAIRLPGVFSGLLGIYLLYKVLIELFESKKKKTHIALIAGFLLAVSPWHIHFSRGAWEVNLALSLSLGGIYFFLKALEKEKYIIVSVILFALTLLSYQGAKLSSLIIVVLLALIYSKELKANVLKNAKPFLLSVVLGIFIALPVITSIFTGKAGRLEVFSVFSYPRPFDYTQAFIDKAGVERDGFLYKTYYSEPLNFTRGILGRWFNHFSGRFLFFEGDYQNPRHTAPNHGVMLLFDMVLLFSGLVFIAGKHKNKGMIFILSWLVLAPLPAVLSRDQVQAVRAFNLVIPLIVICAFGVENLKEMILKNKNCLTRKGCIILSLAFFSASFVFFLDAYFVHLPKYNAKHWYYGYKETVLTVSENQSMYGNILFKQSYDQPYIYFLFYQKYDPLKYQENAFLTKKGIDVGVVEKLDNITFDTFSWPAPAKSKDLVVGDNSSTLGWEEDKTFNLIKEIRYPDKTVAFRILEKI